MRQAGDEFYWTEQWRTCRRDYMKKVGGLCERCKRNGRLVPAEIVHHKIHLTQENKDDPKVAYSFENLEALCRSCHNHEHGDPYDRRFTIGKNGEVITDFRESPLQT